ncbi:exonuclease [Burkholderia phage vB_BceS_AH2]|uniref:Exonuclease n=1 Tax=Burkholderia phage vB_BceS_AH2 TaxID=1133022 RepID=I6NLJ8_9CAUD|nr:exonuclease [Burkholderia phage vB_BceS_AH2]AEY69585.1 exonuclease [Burkholderia phage vB_BceS_AH2]
MFDKLLLDFLAKHYADAAHSIFAPSSSAMWLTCPGALIPNLLARDTAGIEAATGTVAHDLGEHWLKSGERPDRRVGEIVRLAEGDQVFDIEITVEMLNFVQEYVDFCSFMPGKHIVEERVFFSRLTPIPNQGGRMDFAALHRRVAKVVDLKFGEGVHVDAAYDLDDPRSLVLKNGELVANGNTQAMLYALGLLFKYGNEYDLDEFEISIVQPRRENVQTWQTTRKELLRFAKWAKDRAHDAWRLDAPVRPSPKACQWCKVRGNCPAFLKIAEDISNEAFADLIDPINRETAIEVVDAIESGLFDPQFQPPALLSTKAMAKALPFRGVFEKWFSDVEAELEQRAMSGEKVPGQKLVEARSNRVFTDEQKAVKRLAEAGVHWLNLYTTKFISPAQAEDLLAKFGMKKTDAVEFLKSVVRKPPGKPTLAPENDKRPAFVSPDDGVFDDL